MKKIGLFGLTIPQEYGGLGESLLTYALAVEEIARGWMSVSGIINTHFIVAYLVRQHGTEEQKSDCCPGWPPASCAAPFPCPSRTAARTSPASGPRPGRRGRLRIDGQKMWLTNGGRPADRRLCRRTAGGDSVYKNMSTFLIEKEPGFGRSARGLSIPGKIAKMGYKGVETTEMIFDVSVAATGFSAADAGARLLPDDGRDRGGPGQRGRPGCWRRGRAFELAIAYAQQRRTFGKPIAEHQAMRSGWPRWPPRSRRRT